MKRILSFLGIMILIGFFIGLLTNLMPLRADEDDKQKQLPDISLENVTGESYNLSEINELTILFFWLAKSDSCVLQLERLRDFATQNQKVNILTIAIGDVEQEKLMAIKSELNFAFPLLVDKKAALTKELKITTIPTSIIYHPHADNSEVIIGTYEKKELAKQLNSWQKKDSKSFK